MTHWYTNTNARKKVEKIIKKSEREKREARKNRERVRLLYAGSGVLIRWKEVVSWRYTKRRPIEGAEGRQSSHLALKRRLRASFHSSSSFFLFLLFPFDPSFASAHPSRSPSFVFQLHAWPILRPSSTTSSSSPPRPLRVCPPR